MLPASWCSVCVPGRASLLSLRVETVLTPGVMEGLLASGTDIAAGEYIQVFTLIFFLLRCLFTLNNEAVIWTEASQYIGP